MDCVKKALSGKYCFLIIVLLSLLVYFLFLPKKNNSFILQNPIKIMSFNIGGSIIKQKPTLNEVVNFLKAYQWDIIFLQETGSISKLKNLANKLGYHFIPVSSSIKKTDAAILSRFPIKTNFTLTLKGWEKNINAICGNILINDKKLLVCSMHLKNIKLDRTDDGHILTNKIRLLRILTRETFLETYRSKGVDQLLKEINKLSYKAIIIGGDFNSLSFSKAIKKMKDNFKDCSWMNESFFQSSVKAKFLFFPIKVDYIFVSDTLECSDTQILPKSPSDHFPIVTKIAF